MRNSLVMPEAEETPLAFTSIGICPNSDIKCFRNVFTQYTTEHCMSPPWILTQPGTPRRKYICTLWYISQNVLSAKWPQGLSTGDQSSGLHCRLLLEEITLPYCQQTKKWKKYNWWHVQTHTVPCIPISLSLWCRCLHPRYVSPPNPQSSPPGSMSQLGTRCQDVITEVLWYHVTTVVLMGTRSYRWSMGVLRRQWKWTLILLQAGKE